MSFLFVQITRSTAERRSAVPATPRTRGVTLIDSLDTVTLNQHRKQEGALRLDMRILPVSQSQPKSLAGCGDMPDDARSAIGQSIRSPE
jgi:hypothetical protein